MDYGNTICRSLWDVLIRILLRTARITYLLNNIHGQGCVIAEQDPANVNIVIIKCGHVTTIFFRQSTYIRHPKSHLRNVTLVVQKCHMCLIVSIVMLYTVLSLV